ncbi:MAG TPA: glycosyltransferase [Candidatus Syntrophosphaera sp.]|nr:glycosyltransferase [Candidatus Syntrophosphaera sp.]
MRLLLITYYFPPCGGAAVQRWLKWLPDLVENGFKVTVLTTRDGDYPVLDASLAAIVPPSVQVLRARAPRWGKLWSLLSRKNEPLPHGNLAATASFGWWGKLLVWVRVNLVVPDLRRAWNPNAYKTAVAYLRSNPVDAVVTTGPPHSTHLIGLKLKRRFRFSWVADWRDPWTTIYYLRLNPPAPWSLRWQKHLERRVAQTSDLNIVVSEHLANQLPTRNNSVIYNGYDARCWEFLRCEKSLSRQPEGLQLKYVGSITEGQDLTQLAKIIALAMKDQKFCLKLVGTALNSHQRDLLEHKLHDRYRCTDFVPHQQALREMATAQVLLLLINYYPGFEGMLTTKLFEYLASGRPILCLGPHGSEAERLINMYQAGACFDSSETDAAAAYLRDLHQVWQEGHLPRQERDLSTLSSHNQAFKLIEQLRGLKKG